MFFSNLKKSFPGIVLILSGTVGAGILGLPFALGRVGLVPGLFLLFFLGVAMTSLNLLVGEMSYRLGRPLQLAGLVENAFGRVGKGFFSFLLYASLFGTLSIYLTGLSQIWAVFLGVEGFWEVRLIGLVLAILFGSLIFRGLKTIKTVEVFMSLAVLGVITLILIFSVPHVRVEYFSAFDFRNLLLPFGVILFALHGATTIPEVHRLYPTDPRSFRVAIVGAGLVSVIVYALFAIAVIGVLGSEVGQIATISLGRALGEKFFYLGNIFSLLAMSTSFLISGLALRHSLSWDYGLTKNFSSSLVFTVPLVIFFANSRGFAAAIELVGGVFISLEMFFLLLSYLVLRRRIFATKHPFVPLLGLVCFTLSTILLTAVVYNLSSWIF